MARRSSVVGTQNTSESGAEQPPVWFFFFPPTIRLGRQETERRKVNVRARGHASAGG